MTSLRFQLPLASWFKDNPAAGLKVFKSSVDSQLEESPPSSPLTGTGGAGGHFRIWRAFVLCNRIWKCVFEELNNPLYDPFKVASARLFSRLTVELSGFSVGMNGDHSVWNWPPLACQSICLTPQARAVIGGPCTHTPFLTTKQSICPPSRGRPWYGGPCI